MTLLNDKQPAVQAVLGLGVAPQPVMISNRATVDLAKLVQELYEECDGDWQKGQHWLLSAAKQFWRPRTIEADARDIWEYWRHPQSLKVDQLIEQFRALPNDLKIAVLAKADTSIESHSADKPWSSSLINDGNRTYKYHLAVAVPMVLAHPIFQHVSIESVGQFMADWRYGRDDFRGCPCQDFEHVAKNLARKFGLTCSECKKVTRHPACESLGVYERGYLDWPRHLDRPHQWSSGLCPTCWEWKRTLTLSKRRDVAKFAKSVRAAGCEIDNIDTSTGCINIKLAPGRRKKPRKRHSRKVMQWKAAYDALRELDIITEDISNEPDRGAESGSVSGHAANVESQVNTRPSSGVDKG
jgi:hypothetical protein